MSARNVWLDGQRTAEREADYAATILSDRWRARQGHAGSLGHRFAVHAATVDAIASAAETREARS